MGRIASSHPIAGKRLIVPRMSTVGASALSAAMRSFGIQAELAPQSDERTLQLAAKFTTGEECLPQRVTLGNFLKVIESQGFNPDRSAFFMPTSSGPCRFGQYAPLIRKILKDMGLGQIVVFSPTSSDQYEGIGGDVMRFQRTAWRAVLASDILRKLLLMFRPYEAKVGESQSIQDRMLEDCCSILEDASIPLRIQLRLLAGIVEEARDAFVSMQVREEPGSRPLVGIVGEIFLRLDSFSNQNLVRQVEDLGGECWMADVAEWVWYTNAERARKLRERGRAFSLDMIGVHIRDAVQRHDERALVAPLSELFAGRREASTSEILDGSEGYLPAVKALGEMTLNTGKAISFYRSGCDGVIDISPFTCMNAIVTEAVYPSVSRDHDGLPVRIFYFDGVPFDLQGDLEIFMELVRAYRKKRTGRG
jgi:predicted nucleotide-binding protein (sugar kinase/HSP70/actin superfamily)